jgi:hypothetical protein
MKRILPLLLLAAVACKDDPGGGVLTGTSSPEAEARRATKADPTPGNDTALTGTLSSDAPGNAPGTPAETGTHPGATGTDATTLTDPNVSPTDTSTTGAPLQNRTAT